MVHVSIKKVRLSDDSYLEFPPTGLTIVVGPNNAGKSTLLREIDTIASRTSYDNHLETSYSVVKDIEIEKTGSPEEITAWVEDHAEKRRDLNGDLFERVHGNGALTRTTINDYWGMPNRLAGLWRFVSHYMDASTRLGGTATGQYDVNGSSPSSPLHKFYWDEELTDRLRRKSKDVFNQDLYLQRFGSTIQFLLGTPVNNLTASGTPTVELRDEIKIMPPLDAQGSGMKSFMYLMINIMSQVYFTILIDEPEAFLHPPQARSLGSSLVKDVDEETQVIISTHSSDIVRGALSRVTDIPIKIVRLTRDNDLNHAKVINSTDITNLWSDPVLKYSNILDSLFHEAVVICEADTDCKYYSSIHDQLPISSERYTHDNTLYTYAGGKERIAVMVKAMRSIGVDTRVAVDIDILDDKTKLKNLVEASGGLWGGIETDWNTVNADVLGISETIGSVEDMKTIIKNDLETVSTAQQLKEFGKTTKKKLSPRSGWSIVKAGGKSAIPGGNATVAYGRLDTYLKELGIHMVPVGELENFVKSIPHHGPAWIDGVFRAGLHEDSSNQEVLNFVSGLVKK